MKIVTTVGVLALLAASAPAHAQSDLPSVSLRPFVMVAEQSFRASQSFDAVFGETSQPSWGGGVQVAFWENRIYAQVDASRFFTSGGELVGQRVFVSNGQAFPLNIPLRAKITPFEVVGGYRFTTVFRGIVPYVGAGFTSYHYTEQSEFAESSENLDVTHSGFVFQGGAEFRVWRWVALAGEAQFAHVPGVLGNGGASLEFGASSSAERDLGGWAGRFVVLVGR
jgi:hypothetical protein